MRSRLALLLIALLAWGGVVAGCGSKFELPTERRIGRGVPANGSYQMIATWPGMDGIQDVLLTPGSGTQLFLLFNHSNGAGAGPGEVFDFYLSRPQTLGSFTQQGLLNPVALSAGGDGSGGVNNRVLVLEQGDTLNAKTTFTVCDSCGDGKTPVRRRYVTDLSKYWHVREYSLLGAPISSFTDTSMAFVNGVAADNEGSVYVSGMAIVYTQSSTSQFLYVRSFVSRVNKYRRGPRYPGVVPADRNMPGADWHRDTTYFHTQGAGVGYVNDPRGMVWSPNSPAGLFVADYGNNSAQKLSDSDTTGVYRLDRDYDGAPSTGPQDVAVDEAGFVYVTDSGNRRVLRFDPDGEYVQRVDVEPDALGLPLLNPVSAAANDSVVYVADRGRGEIIRYQRRQ